MRRDAGFSLFEVLVAFAIMTMVLAALLPGQAKFLARASGGDDRLLAQDYALSRIARLGVSEDIAEGATSHALGDWQVIEQASLRTGNDDRLVFDVTVIVRDGVDHELARAVTIRSVDR